MSPTAYGPQYLIMTSTGCTHNMLPTGLYPQYVIHRIHPRHVAHYYVSTGYIKLLWVMSCGQHFMSCGVLPWTTWVLSTGHTLGVVHGTCWMSSTGHKMLSTGAQGGTVGTQLMSRGRHFSVSLRCRFPASPVDNTCPVGYIQWVTF